MTDNLDYIEDYLKNTPGNEEQKAFEKRIIEDPGFAEELSFYLTATHAVREEANAEKKKHFRELYQRQNAPVISMFRYVAAAAAIIGVVLGIYLFFPAPTPDRIAQKYITEHLSTLGVLMNGNKDSMQVAIQLYNDGNLAGASARFHTILESSPNNAKAREYAGIVSLRLEDYDKALEHFQVLSENPSLYANPGKFYYSLTLLKRNRPGDVQRAKTILRQVVDEHAANENAARKMLDQL